MKPLDRIPTSKVERASKLVSTGAKVGGNYLKYYGNRLLQSKAEAESQLQKDNAEDIYNGLKELKGSALKFAQMLSMDQGMLPQAYVEKFSLAQFSVPPLSYPLVEKTFRSEFGKSTRDLFSSFEKDAVHAASIGQVHKAAIGDQDLAVKIQYPGVAESVESDLSLVKPFALRLLKISAKEVDTYFNEVKSKLIEETDYKNELQQGLFIKENCSHMSGLRIPKYFPELSSERILTMEYMKGEHLSTFSNGDAKEDVRNSIAQTLWDFFMFQIHELRIVHADPHPGNFIVDKNNQLIALDFGCMKVIPVEFYEPYFELINVSDTSDDEHFHHLLLELEILKSTDSDDEKEEISTLFKRVIKLITSPFRSEFFDFSDPSFIQSIHDLANELMKDGAMRNQDAGRGSKHFIYMNRMFFGLYNLLMSLKATKVNTGYAGK